MKKLVTVAALVAMAVLGVAAVLAGTAFAEEKETVWLCNERAVAKAEECLVVSENLEVFIFQDRGANAQVRCAIGGFLNEGWVGPGAEDRLTTITLTNCVATPKAVNLKEEEVANACQEGTATVKAVNVPWKTKLRLIAAVTYDTVSSGGSGQPGWAVTCKTVLGEIKDECLESEANPLTALIDNLPLEGTDFPLVDVLFSPKKSEYLEGEKEFGKCTVGGAESGVATGEILVAALTVNNLAFESLETSEA